MIAPSLRTTPSLRMAEWSRAARSVILLAAALAVLPLMALAQGDYRVTAGDSLLFEVLEDGDLDRVVLVTPNGEISLPLVGAVRAAGRTLTSIQLELRDRLAPNFSNPPTVFLSLNAAAPKEPPLPPREEKEEEPETIKIYALGEVNNPGLREVEVGTTLLQALSQVGGFSNFAATKRVQLRRRDPYSGLERIYVLNYDAIRLGRSPNGAVTMLEGDVLLVPTRKLFE